MFCICLRLCYCKGLMAHLLNLCLSQAAQVSRTSKQSSSSLWQYSPGSPSPCRLQDLEALCPTVLERPGHGPDALEGVLLQHNSAAELQQSLLYHFPGSILRCPWASLRGRPVSYRV